MNALDGGSIDRLARLIANHLKSGGAVLAASHQALPGDWLRVDLGVQRAADQAGVMNLVQGGIERTWLTQSIIVSRRLSCVWSRPVRLMRRDEVLNGLPLAGSLPGMAM